jgi:hypothetical protein
LSSFKASLIPYPALLWVREKEQLCHQHGLKQLRRSMFLCDKSTPLGKLPFGHMGPCRSQQPCYHPNLSRPRPRLSACNVPGSMPVLGSLPSYSQHTIKFTQSHPQQTARLWTENMTWGG